MSQPEAFRPIGRLTMHNATQVREQGLQAIAAGQAIIALDGLTDTDSAAVATLLAWQRAAQKTKVTVVFTLMPTGLHSLVALYGLTELLAA